MGLRRCGVWAGWKGGAEYPRLCALLAPQLPRVFAPRLRFVFLSSPSQQPIFGHQITKVQPPSRTPTTSIF